MILQMHTYALLHFCLCVLHFNAKISFKKQASKFFKNANIIKDKRGWGIVLAQRRQHRCDNEIQQTIPDWILNEKEKSSKGYYWTTEGT